MKISHSLLSYLSDLVFRLNLTLSSDDPNYRNGVCYEYIKASFPDFVQNYKVKNLSIKSSDSFKVAYYPLFDNSVISGRNLERLVDDVISYYTPTINVNDFSTLSTKNEIVDYFFSHSEIDDDSVVNMIDPIVTVDNSEDVVFKDDFDACKVKYSLVKSDNSYISENKMIKVENIYRRCNVDRISLKALINNWFVIGAYDSTEIDKLETLIYLYGLDYAVLTPSMELVRKKLNNDLNNPVKLPLFVTKAVVVSKPFGIMLWDLIEMVYSVKMNTTDDKDKYLYFLMLQLLNRFDIHNIDQLVRLDIEINFIGKLYKRKNHYLLFTLVDGMFSDDLISGSTLLTLDKLKMMFSGVLLKMVKKIKYQLIDEVPFIDRYCVTPLTYFGSESDFVMQRDAAICLLTLLLRYVSMLEVVD